MNFFSLNKFLNKNQLHKVLNQEVLKWLNNNLIYFISKPHPNLIILLMIQNYDSKRFLNSKVKRWLHHINNLVVRPLLQKQINNNINNLKNSWKIIDKNWIQLFKVMTKIHNKYTSNNLPSKATILTKISTIELFKNIDRK
jgi:hypothetical protein